MPSRFGSGASAFSGRLFIASALLLLSACGGAGGGGSERPALSIDAQFIDETAKQDGEAPVRSVVATLSHAQDAPLQAYWNFSQRGVAGVDLTALSDRQARLDINFKQPGELERGVYNDTIEFRVCADPECTREIDGSPAIISTRFEVTDPDDPFFDEPQTTARRIPATILDLGASRIVWDEFSGLLYATIPAGTSGEGEPNDYANSVIAIDPQTHQIVRSVFAGSDPDQIEVSDDGSYLYVGFLNSSRVRRFDLPEMTQSLEISLGVNDRGESLFARDIVIAPGQPGTIAVSMDRTNRAPDFEKLTVFDDGVPRPNEVTFQSVHTAVYPTALAWSEDGASIYGKNNESSGDNLYVFAVEEAGLSLAASYQNAFIGHGDSITSSEGLVYAADGTVLDGSDGSAYGQYPSRDAFTEQLVVDTERRLALAVSGDYYEAQGATTLQSFDLDQFTVIDTVAIRLGGRYDSLSLKGKSLVRWGEQGLAYVNDGTTPYNGDGLVVIIDDPFVIGEVAERKHMQAGW